MKTLFEGKTCIAEYFPEKRRVIYTLNGYPNVDEHKKMYLEIFEFMKSNPVNAFMHDLRQMKGTFTQLNDWLVETFRPAIQLGLKYGALVLNNDVFTAFAASDVIKKATVVQIQVFKTVAEAEKWLDDKIEE